MGGLCLGIGKFTGNRAMAGMNLEDFAQRVFSACADSPIVLSSFVQDTRSNAIRLRLLLVDETFLDVFYLQ